MKMIFKFKFPGFTKDEINDLPIKYKRQPIGKILEVEETDEGLIVTGQFNEDIAAEPASPKIIRMRGRT